jgi:hypothetical protein
VKEGRVDLKSGELMFGHPTTIVHVLNNSKSRERVRGLKRFPSPSSFTLLPWGAVSLVTGHTGGDLPRWSGRKA